MLNFKICYDKNIEVHRKFLRILICLVTAVFCQTRTDIYGFRNNRGNIFQQHGSQLRSSTVFRNVYAPYGHPPTLNRSATTVFRSRSFPELQSRSYLPRSKKEAVTITTQQIRAVVGID